MAWTDKARAASAAARRARAKSPWEKALTKRGWTTSTGGRNTAFKTFGLAMKNSYRAYSKVIRSGGGFKAAVRRFGQVKRTHKI